MKTKISALALAALLFVGLPLASTSAYVGISVAIAPPAIPVYAQPVCPAPGYIWTPGYWAYADFGYYWVPGVWVLPPSVGLLWTPGYWAYSGGTYVFNQGYWGPTVGFYGGINYGYGYGGHGYYGGHWVGNTFRYNTAVTRVNPSVIHNTYVNRDVVRRNRTGSRAGFNGPGGVKAKPSSRELAAAKAERIPPTATQRLRSEAAKKEPALHAANNHGKPKSEAIREFQTKNRSQSVAETAAGGSKGVHKTSAENKTGSARQAGAERASSKTLKTSDRAREKVAASHVRSSAPASHHAKAKKVTSAFHSPSHARSSNQARHRREAKRVASAPHAAHRAHVVWHHSTEVADGRHGHFVPRGDRAHEAHYAKGKKGEKKGQGG